ncbi:MAG: hypothetical protein WC523_03835 [Patescibacteria group bacterium]
MKIWNLIEWFCLGATVVAAITLAGFFLTKALMFLGWGFCLLILVLFILLVGVRKLIKESEI